MKKEIKRAIFLIIGIILVVGTLEIVKNIDKTGKALKKIGYNKEEIVLIKEKLDENQIEKILSMEYQESLKNIVVEQYYIPYNLEEYLEYSNKYENTSNLISSVNVGSNKSFYTDTKQADTSDDIKILVNKYNYLEKNFKPDDIVKVSVMYAYEGHSTRKEVYDQYVKMWKDAKEEGLVLLVNSSYRDYQQQEKEYNNSDDDYAARPGFSEHQTGLALDIVTYNTIGNDFENKPEFKWLQKNAHKYGFILRYPKDMEHITGYEYESWHYRYLGVDLATKVYNSNLTYDEYYAYYCEYKNEC